MNKTILIAGGASVASLAAGGAAGYFFAKRRWQNHFLNELEHELTSARKVFAVQLMQAKEGKPDSVLDVPISEEVEESDEEPDDDDILQAESDKALTNYRKFADNAGTRVVDNNIFSSSATPAKRLPPRDDTGKFRPRVQPVQESAENGGPYLISDEDFLENKTDYFQRYLLYFADEDTLMQAHNTGETFEIAVVGAVNLTKFPKVDDGESRNIYVRNDQTEEDYEILMMQDPLIDYIGLQES